MVAGDSPACVQLHSPAIDWTPCSGGFSLHSLIASHLPVAPRFSALRPQSRTSSSSLWIRLAPTAWVFSARRAKLTPNLDGLARQSMVFEQAYSQAPLTVVSHATILSGTYPQTHDVTRIRRQACAGAAVSSGLAAGARISHGRFRRLHRTRSEERIGPRLRPRIRSVRRRLSTAARGDRAFRLTGPRRRWSLAPVAWLAHNPSRPFFLWVHLNDPQRLRTDSSYNAAVAAADAAVGKLIAALRASKLYDDALIVITADHGQSLGAHGEETHGIFLYDETIRVPLLLKLPAKPERGKASHSARPGWWTSLPPFSKLRACPSHRRCRDSRCCESRRRIPISRFIRSAIFRNGRSAGARWNPGARENISTSRRPSPNFTISRPIPAPRTTWRRVRRPRSKPSPAQLDAFDRRFSDAGNSGWP